MKYTSDYQPRKSKKWPILEVRFEKKIDFRGGGIFRIIEKNIDNLKIQKFIKEGGGAQER